METRLIWVKKFLLTSWFTFLSNGWTQRVKARQQVTAKRQLRTNSYLRRKLLVLGRNRPKLGLKENFPHLSHLPRSYSSSWHFPGWIFTAFLLCFQIQRLFFFFFLIGAKNGRQQNTRVTFSSCSFSLVRKKIWKVLHTLGTIPSFALPRKTNARKMLRWLQTVHISALFVTRVLSLVCLGSFSLSFEHEKGQSQPIAGVSGMNKK